MSEPFLAEIRIVGFNFAPRGWAFCDGEILPINQNQSLYSLLGTTYGGDGRTSFGLPDLRGRTPIHVGSANGVSHREGQKGGEETVTLGVAQMPTHNHDVRGSSTAGDTNRPAGHLLAREQGSIYRQSLTNPVSMPNSAVTSVGGGQAHDNMQPYLTLNFCIALRGLFPSRN